MVNKNISIGTNYTLKTGEVNLTLITGSGAINGTGNGTKNTITGNESDNILDGKAGGDVLIGGAGNDTYIVDNVRDLITENSGEGTDDLILSSVSYVIGANVENLSLTGVRSINGTGNSAVNTITGNAKNNILDGKGGADVLSGGAGNDTYIITNTGVTVLDSSGIDLVKAGIDYSLEAELENLSLTGFAVNGWGNASINTITGNVAANILDGKGGADKLIGGKGDDTYIIDNTGVKVTESAKSGIDLVIAGVNYTLSTNVENLSLTGSTIFGTGNASINTITGNDAANVLNGRGGADKLIGGAGNDTYIIANAGVTITENSEEGIDLVQSSISYSLSANVENLSLAGAKAVNGTGNSVVNTITGNAKNNILDGKGGADVLIGGKGNDTYIIGNTGVTITEVSGEGLDLVKASADYSLDATVENLSLTGSVAIYGTGNTLKNTITGNNADNILDGKGGSDKLIGGKGNDTYIIDNTGVSITEAAKSGTDLVIASISYTLSANIENLTLGGTAIIGVGNSSTNSITGNAAANLINGKGGADTFVGKSGDDTYIVDNTGITITEVSDEGTDLVKTSVSFSLAPEVENLSLIGAKAINGKGNTLVNTITGNGAANVLDGQGGNDVLIGGKGNDTYIIDNTGVSIIEVLGEGTDLIKSSIDYSLDATVENLSLTGSVAIYGTGNTLANTITGNDVANVLDGKGGKDKLMGGDGDDTYIVNNTGVTVTESSNHGTDLVIASVTYILNSYSENLSLDGTDAINGLGNTSVNTITGNDAANVIDGRGGADILIGKKGDDTYIVDNIADTVMEDLNEGIDLVKAGVSYTLSENIENLSLTGVIVTNGTGNDLNNTITGNLKNNILDGQDGADVLIGGKGDDTYIIDNTGDSITEITSEGIDLVIAKVDYSLKANVENLTLANVTGLFLSINAYGNTLVNTLTGNADNNILDGGGGADTLIGRDGNDTYLIDNTGVKITESLGQGTDLVNSSISYTLTANIENMSLTGLAAIGVGNTDINTITGNSLANVLDGGGGADTLIGGDGDDTYVIDNTEDVTVAEESGKGNDLVKAGISYTLLANIENLSLMGASAIDGAGNDLNNTITGNLKNNILDGQDGADVLIGGKGDDTYIIDNTGDSITEITSEGVDLVIAKVDYSLKSNVENLTLANVTGLFLSINAYGNTSVNTLTGNADNNILDGKGGADTLVGEDGDDTYVIDNTGVTVTEATNQGNDLVKAGISYTLTANVEDLSLTEVSAINGTGNTDVNTITGNSLANVLDGGGGADTLIGGDGDDTYVIDNTEDVTVTEESGKGNDLVKAGISYTLLANFENLSLTGASAIDGTGNTDVNTITGNSLVNVLDGGGGADTLIGGDGDDTYVIDNTGVTVTEITSKGTDLVKAGISYTLTANVENMSLTGSTAIGVGNTGVNTITGNTAANTLDGGGGADTLIGGDGNDTYLIDNTGVTITESLGQGTDLVNSSISYTLTANIENMSLTGSAAIGVGNTDINTITGNSLANVLDGGGGADTLIGGDGNDTYLIDNTGVTVTESSGQGNDLVKASISYTLLANFENLSLAGVSAINGTGNTDVNTITGNSLSNVLNGGAGADTLIGDAGNDTYVLAAGSGADTINADTGGTADLVDITAAGKVKGDIAILNSGSDLVVSYSNDNTDTVTIKTYANIEKIQIASGSFLNQTGINEIVAAIAQYKVDHSSVTLDTVAQVRSETALMTIIRHSWI